MPDPLPDTRPTDAAKHVEPRSHASLSPDQLAESKRYGRRGLACTLVDMVIDVTYLSLMAFWGARIIDVWLLSTGPVMQSTWIRLSGIYLIVMGLHYVVSFPLSIYSGYLLEHQFGLSRQSVWHWLRRHLLKSVLVTGLGWLLMLGLFALIWWVGRWWWLVAAAATFLVTILLGQLVPVIILPLFYKIKPLEDQELTDRFVRLTHDTSLRVRGVYRMELSVETSKANAMLTGLGNTRRVLLGDTLLVDFTPEEIEVVLAHEIGHHVHRHIAKLIGIGLFSSAVSFFLCDRILVAWLTSQQGSFDYANVPPYALPLIMLATTVISLVASPLRNGISRWFEDQADRYALEVTGNSAAFLSAFSKLAQQNKADPDPPKLEVWLLHDHPPIGARLARARESGNNR